MAVLMRPCVLQFYEGLVQANPMVYSDMAEDKQQALSAAVGISTAPTAAVR